MNIYSFISQKGGVGKTAFNWHLACAYAHLYPEKKVLFIDGTHIQGSRSLSLAHDQNQAGDGLGHVLHVAFGNLLPDLPLSRQASAFVRARDLGIELFKSFVVPVVVSGVATLDFMPAAHPILKKVNNPDHWREDRRGQMLSEILSGLTYDYCLIDCTADVGLPLQESVMTIADKVILLQDARDYESLAGLDVLIKSSAHNAVGLVGNYVDPHIDVRKISKSVETVNALKKVCETFNLPLLDLIKDGIKSISNGMSVYELDNGMVGSSLYVEADRERSQRKNVDAIAQRFERLAKFLENQHA